MGQLGEALGGQAGSLGSKRHISCKQCGMPLCHPPVPHQAVLPAKLLTGCQWVAASGMQIVVADRDL